MTEFNMTPVALDQLPEQAGIIMMTDAAGNIVAVASARNALERAMKYAEQIDFTGVVYWPLAYKQSDALAKRIRKCDPQVLKGNPFHNKELQG